MPSSTVTPAPAVLVGAGDISICGQDGDDQTASLLDELTGTVFTAGDNSNEDGTVEQYIRCFESSWGRHRDRMYPSAGNHDYGEGDGSPYFSYFGEAAGESGKGYYSYELGSWHIIVLNSNCGQVGCGLNSAQEQWLRADLEAYPARCSLAYWHHPRWSSGFAGNDGRLAPLWRALYEYGVDVVVNGHEHHYERFAPQNPDGKMDLEKGIRQFVVGTGGVNHLGFSEIHPNSEVRDSTSFGVIRFLLYPESYEWEFIPVEGSSFTDQGSGFCH